MSFVTPEYMLFFCVAVPLYFAVSPHWRWLFLLAVSYVFYASGNVSSTLLLVFTTAVGYFGGGFIAAADTPGQRRFYLVLSIAANLLMLFFFKYFNVFAASLNNLFAALNLSANIGTSNVILPIGISFYTFVCMGYLLDAYRGTVSAEKHPGIFGAFIAFWPTLVSGPIERAERMLPQFRQPMMFDYGRIIEGLRSILWGFFKKVVIADRLAIYVNAVYDQSHLYSGPVLLAATVFLAFQIYADFSSYSDIAIGTAKVLGFDLMLNFRQPYFSSSVLEFWRRWHISLTSWIREFVFIPLSRALLRRTNRRYPRLIEVSAYLFVMLLVGLWHGAAWTFVIWGGLHGLYMGVETLSRTWRLRLPQSLPPMIANILRMSFTFALVCFAWIFFRSNSLADAQYIATHLFVFPVDGWAKVVTPFASDAAGALGLNERVQFALSVGLIVLLMSVDYLDARYGLNLILNRNTRVVRWLVYYGALATLLILGIWGAQEFIYFQF